MVSKEPNHLLTGQPNGKSTLADKMPGTITVRSVLLNRDSPDIESRLKRRRNRTHKVHFKDLEDGSSSSGNSGTGDNNSHQRPATDCDSPHPVRKHSSRSIKPWSDRDGLHADSLPGQTSVVGAVRGDMASTIEVVAAFLARAPPHPLTPGPTRRCWVPPQTNSLTLPMTRKPSTSTAIQTSPCLRKPHSLSSNHTRSQSFGDSVGMDGDDEHDSQDEFLLHNHALLPWSKHQNGPPAIVDRPVVERRSKASRTDNKSAVAVIKNSRHSCPPSVSQITESCQCSSSCQEGPKRSGSVTPSIVRRRKRLNRTTSDPGKEIHYCTTPTQTERPCSSPPPSNTKHCTTQVQTESVCPPVTTKYCTTQCQTETPQQSPVLSNTKSKPSTQEGSDSSLPPGPEQSITTLQTESASHSTPNPSDAESDIPRDLSSLPVSSESNVDLADRTSSQTVPSETPVTERNTVPYCTTPSPTNQPMQTPENETKLSCPQPQAVCINPIPGKEPPISVCTSASSLNHHPTVSYFTVVSPCPNSAVVACPSPSSNAAPCPTLTETSSAKTILSTSPAVCSTTALIAPPNETPPDPPPNIPDKSQQKEIMATTKQIPCTFVTQTALSCTSISYYTTTHATVPQGFPNNTTKPSYATVIQTVSHCNVPCRSLQNTSAASSGITPYSSPVPRLKSCTSPPPLVKTGTSTLPNAQRCITPTKAVPLYSSTFRAAPPYTPPSQVPYSAQDKRGMRLPPPPPPPPPYTPRKKEGDPPGPTVQTPKLRAESNPVKKEKDNEKENGENQKCTDSPKRCERANSLVHRAQTPPVSVMKVEKQPSSSSPLKACFKSSCLSSAQAQLGMLHKMLCSGASTRPSTPNSQHALPSNQQGCSGTKGCAASADKPTAGPLTAAQADTLRQVQEILGGLMSGARCKLDPAKVAEKLLSPNGPLRDIRSLQTQLQSLEGVLETSQNTIKVLLDVIQDLEKKEAERDGRHSYRAGQDIENCGTCRDCACIIYSVEHDFRLQEGQVVRTWKVGDPPEDMPQTSTPVHTVPQQQDSPQPVRPPAAAKKNKKKCFWFL
ncbi:uncharacterized protein ACB058_004419 isoform 1-T2 [Synchiropus picturatus]